MSVIGKIHSTESFGAVDGPGVRFVVFMQGCPLRCLYCHNPDTWVFHGGHEISSDELIAQILTYKSFISKGGVTLSGGEPLMQADFCREIALKCRENGLHTAIDTSGAVSLERSKDAIDAADMLLLDIKAENADDCRRITGMSNRHAFETLDYCEAVGKDIWIRHVLLPEYTLDDDKLRRLFSRLEKYSCIKKVELLPYHTMGLKKWEALGIHSEIAHIEPPKRSEVEHARDIMREFEINWTGDIH